MISKQVEAVLQALLVTLLWSTSWVLIKIGLDEIPALTFAGLRYSMAFLCLLPLALLRHNRRYLKSMSGNQWLQLALLGILYYAIVQGLIFLALAYLPAASTSLVWSLTSLFVALAGTIWLGEKLSWIGWFGVGLSVAGPLVFFSQAARIPAGGLGLVIAIFGMLANVGAAILGRYVNRQENLPPVMITTISMGVGAFVLLLAGTGIEGMPALNWSHLAIIAWLAVVNTAFAFTLWNHTLRTLNAAQSSVINNTMVIQVALLAWLFLGESLDGWEWLGIILAGAGAVLVQLRRKSLGVVNG